MSTFETAEQRQIRELRAAVRSLENAASDARKNGDRARHRMEEEQRRVLEENQRLNDQLRSQHKRDRKQQSAIARQDERLRALDREIRQKEELQAQRLEEMREQHERELGRLQREFSAEQMQLQQVVSAARTEMREKLEAARRENDQKLKAQEQRLSVRIQETALELEEKLQETDKKIESVISRLKEKEENEHTLARYWMEQANRIMEDMRDNYRPELFEGEAYRKLRERLRLYQSDLVGGSCIAAAYGGRDAFYEAVDLREKLIQEEMEWNLWFNEVKQREIRLLDQLAGAEGRVYEVELDGENIRDDSGIDYWTGGQLSVLRERIERASREMENLKDRTSEELKEAVNQLVVLEEEMLCLENASQTNFTMAVNRMQTAEKIGAVLGDAYLMIESDGDFFGEENREAYHAIFQNPNTRDQAAVVITPLYGEDGIVTNHVELIVGNADNNPVKREQITRLVEARLSEQGVITGDFSCGLKYREKTPQEVARVGNISDVSAGRECARSVTVQRTVTEQNPLFSQAAAGKRTAVQNASAAGAQGRAGTVQKPV